MCVSNVIHVRASILLRTFHRRSSTNPLWSHPLWEINYTPVQNSHRGWIESGLVNRETDSLFFALIALSLIAYCLIAMDLYDHLIFCQAFVMDRDVLGIIAPSKCASLVD